MNFTRNLIILTLVLLGATYLLGTFSTLNIVLPDTYMAVGYFFGLTWIVHGMSVRASQRSPQSFIRFFMGSTALRLFVHLLVVIAYRLTFHERSVPFLIAFMIFYIIFQVFEVSSLLRFLRKK
jgi:hypothetical protein